MFLLVVIAVLSLMYGYIGWRMIIPADFSTPVNILLWAIIIAALILPFLLVLMRFRGVDGNSLDTLAWVAYFLFGFMTLLFAILLAKDVVYLFSLGIHKLVSLFGSANAADAFNPERRRMLTNYLNLGVLGITGTMAGYGLYGALRKPAIVDVKVPIRNLPPAFDGFRIVQITDIHTSYTIKRPFIQEVVDTVNSLNPDLIALTGDLVDGSVPQLRNDVAPLAGLNAPHGYFFITGNHEYYSGVEQWIAETARLGFDVLLNEHRILEKDGQRIILAGVTDYSAGAYIKSQATDPRKAISGAPENLIKILLAHQPKSVFEASKLGYDYVISGHTHGGQYFPYQFLTALDQPYISGLHDHEGTWIYVSRGTGYWGPPFRIAARSEITVHTLTTA
jgi:predicted MPP superfamily phosphohydrolase